MSDFENWLWGCVVCLFVVDCFGDCSVVVGC